MFFFFDLIFFDLILLIIFWNKYDVIKVVFINKFLIIVENGFILIGWYIILECLDMLFEEYYG